MRKSPPFGGDFFCPFRVRPPGAPSQMGRREAPSEHFCGAKISAQAEFTSAEHLKKKGSRESGAFVGLAAPWVPALLSTSRSNSYSLRKSPPFGGDFFCPFRVRPPGAPSQMGRREAPSEHFCGAKISAQAEFTSAEHLKKKGSRESGAFVGLAAPWEKRCYRHRGVIYSLEKSPPDGGDFFLPRYRAAALGAPRRGPKAGPAQRAALGEEEQGSGRSFRR